MPCIEESSYVSGRYYVLDDVWVNQQCAADNPAACAGQAESIMWDVDSAPHMFDRGGVPLPQSVRYGDKISGTTEKVAARPLQVNAGYEVGVKITGFKGQQEYGRTFFSVAEFRIEPDGKGGLKLTQRGGNSCEYKGGND